MQSSDSRPLSWAALAVLLGIALAIGAAVSLTAPSGRAAALTSGDSLRGFDSEQGLAAFARTMAVREGEAFAVYEAAMDAAPSVSYSITVPADEPPPPPEESAGSESITNTQEAGVDEGGIVKRAGDYLVVLRRGRLFTIRVGGDALAPVAMVDAFPPDKRDPDETWYDEMLVHGSQIIVIGYSYGDFGTEVNRFDLGKDGALAWRDTHYLRSGDYYSSSNYASRLIGDELVLYTPVYARWAEFDAMLPAIRERDPKARPKVLVEPEDFLVAQPYRSGRYPLDVLHVVTRCDLSAADLECSATAIAGTWSHAFYVSQTAVYAWTGLSEATSGTFRAATAGQLYRIPLDGGRPAGVQVRGSPTDQFSFAEDAAKGVLRVLLRDQGAGEGMWASEGGAGPVRLATIPLGSFGDGSGALGADRYRTLPQPPEGRIFNRFAGDYLLYAAAPYYGDGAEQGTVFAVPLGGGTVQDIALPHGVSRFDRMGSDAVVIGPAQGDARGDALGFSALSLGAAVRIEDTYVLPAASEGESRSQAFFYRPDPGSEGGQSGILGLPVMRGDDASAAIVFLRRNARTFDPAGALAAAAGRGRDDRCKASCVDWYGNARPIFMGDRIMALMGYELVEGSLAAGRITERRRTSFAP